MTIQPTSRAAYDTANLPRRQLQVHDALSDHGPQTDLELSVTTGLPINVICGARNALVKLGLVRDSGRKRLSRFGKENIVWELVRRDPEAAQADPREDPGQLTIALFP